jgi:hypothetical protein
MFFNFYLPLLSPFTKYLAQVSFSHAHGSFSHLPRARLLLPRARSRRPRSCRPRPRRLRLRRPRRPRPGRRPPQLHRPRPAPSHLTPTAPRPAPATVPATDLDRALPPWSPPRPPPALVAVAAVSPTPGSAHPRGARPQQCPVFMRTAAPPPIDPARRRPLRSHRPHRGRPRPKSSIHTRCDRQVPCLYFFYFLLNVLTSESLLK